MATRSRTPRLPGFGRKGPESERLVTAEKTSIKSRSKVCLRRGEGLRDCKLPAKGLLESAISSASYDDALIGALYARGFLLVKHRIDPPVQTWQESQFGDWWLYRDPRVGVERSLGESTTILLLGRAILLGAIGSHRTEIAQHLVHHYEISRQRFDECVELLCGNYVLMAAHGRDLSVQSDAAGLRSIFYSPEGKAVGSHAGLVASRSRSRPTAFSDSSWETGDSVSYLPGVRTVFEGVLQLTPNTELQLDKMAPRRIFPRRPPLSLEVPEIPERLDPMSAGQLNDISHETWVLINSRRVLELLLAASLPKRIEAAVSHRLISSRWPDLARWPRNALPDRRDTALPSPDMDQTGTHVS